MRYVIGNVPPDHFAWLVERTSVVLTSDFIALAAVDTEHNEECHYCGRIHPRVGGMVGFSDWTPNSATMHVALADRGAGRVLHDEVFKYLFVDCGRRMAIGVTRNNNLHAMKLAKHLGFKPLGVVKDGYADGDDVTISILTKERWVANREARAQHVR